MKRLLIVAVIVPVLMASLFCARPPESRPNFLFIVIDCWRYDHFNAQITPNIWNLGQKGALFEDYYVNAGYTRPSMGAMFSSQFPYFKQGEKYAASGFRRFGGTKVNRRRLETFSKNLLTFPEMLNKKGYETIAVTQSVNTGIGGGYGSKQWDRLLEVPYSVRDDLDIAGEYVTNEGIKQLLIRNKNKSYLLYVHYMDAHFLYDRSHLSETEISRQREYYDTKNGENLELRRALLPEAFQHYKDGLRFIDSQIGRLIANADLTDTIIIVTSDHGELFGEDGYIGHPGRLPEQIVHVPLIIAGSGIESIANDHMVQSVDLMPTILALAGISSPSDIQGQALFSPDYVPKPIVAFSHLETAFISEEKITRSPLVKLNKTDDEIVQELKALGYLE